jgi:hypothetical protein
MYKSVAYNTFSPCVDIVVMPLLFKRIYIVSPAAIGE